MPPEERGGHAVAESAKQLVHVLVVEHFHVHAQLGLQQTRRVLPHRRALLRVERVQVLNQTHAARQALVSETGEKQVGLGVHRLLLAAVHAGQKHAEVGDFAGIEDVLQILSAAEKSQTTLEFLQYNRHWLRYTVL